MICWAGATQAKASSAGSKWVRVMMLVLAWCGGDRVYGMACAELCKIVHEFAGLPELAYGGFFKFEPTSLLFAMHILSELRCRMAAGMCRGGGPLRS